MTISEATRDQMRELAARYPKSRSALLPMLHLVQSVDDEVTTDGINACAEVLGITSAEVTAVASFYTMYKRKPVGKHHIGVCTNTLCGLLGGDAVFAALSERLGTGHNEPSPDGDFWLEHIECQAACTHAPVMTVDWEYMDDVTPASAVEVVDRLARGEQVASTRGPVIRDFKSTEHTLVYPLDGLVNEGEAVDAKMLAGLRLANERGFGTGGGGLMITSGLTPIITEHWDKADLYTIDGYRRVGGYQALTAALKMDPDAIIGQVKDSGLRGRGGAGFPTGMKWGFVPQNDGKPHYLVVNADESEPGACKDIPIMLANPHALVEGVIIASYAIRASHAFIYIRGEVPHAIRKVANAVEQARAAGFIGENIFGSGFSLDVVVHSGAGAYICGEETALLDSLEGYRGQPRLKPPFPAVSGLYASPTVINNVETIANIPYIMDRGVAWFRQFGTEKSPGFKVFSISGHVVRPGIYEAPLGITMRELLDYAGGIRGGGRVKFWLPGGSSVPMLTAEHLDTPMTYEDMAAVGTMLGTGTPMLFDETVSVVKAVTRWLEFYKHESCGKCTPCREGTYWITGVLEKFEHGHGSAAEVDTLVNLCSQIAGQSFCALGDAAATPYPAALKYFRHEFEAAMTTSADEQFNPVASYVFAEAATR